MNSVEITDIYNLDYFFISASTNIRGIKTYEKLIANGSKIKNLFVIDFEFTRPSIESNEYTKNYNYYLSLPNAKIIVCHSCNDCADKINNIRIKENDIVGIDITGFLTPDMFKTLYVLNKIKKIKSIKLFYTEANRYVVSALDSFRYFNGELKCTVLNEYYISSNRKAELLVIFLGFDRIVSDYVNEQLNPNKTIVINGFPAYYPKLKDQSLLNNYELISKIDKENIYYTVANNPYCAYNTLCDIAKSNTDYIMNICTLGNKPMALGACLYALNHPEYCKVTFPYPERYEIDLSESSEKSWCYEFDFEY